MGRGPANAGWTYGRGPLDLVAAPLSRGNEPMGPSGLQAGTNSSGYRWLASKLGQAKTMNCLRCAGNPTGVQ